MNAGASPQHLVQLSFVMTALTPFPSELVPGSRLEVRQVASRKTDGDPVVYVIQFCNHLGTHIETPAHHVDRAPGIADFTVDEFVFDRPVVLDVDVAMGEAIEPSHLEPHTEAISGADLLLLRTGACNHATDDPETYMRSSPGLSVAAARHLAGFAGLRALGLDAWSLGRLSHPDESREAHNILLGKGRRFLIIETMDLRELDVPPAQVIALPLLVEGLDAAPCTVLGVIDSPER